MRKLSAVLFGMLLMAVSANAQSAKEIFAAIGDKLPETAEITAALKTEKPFAEKIKALDALIAKMDKLREDLEAGKISYSYKKPDVMKDPDGFAADMERRSELQEKISELGEVVVTTVDQLRVHFDELDEFANNYQDDPSFEDRHNTITSQSQKSTGDKAKDLAVINKVQSELYELNCEKFTASIDQRLAYLRKCYSELLEKRAQLVDFDETSFEYYSMMGNNVGAEMNQVRGIMMEFVKKYKAVLESEQPVKLIQYKTYEEAVTSAQ